MRVVYLYESTKRHECWEALVPPPSLAKFPPVSPASYIGEGLPLPFFRARRDGLGEISSLVVLLVGASQLLWTMVARCCPVCRATFRELLRLPMIRVEGG